MEGHFLLLFGMGWLLGVALEVASDGEGGPTQSGRCCYHLDQGEGLDAAGAVKGGVHRAGSCSGGDTPKGMLNRADVGAFPSSKWYRITIMPWLSGVLALRAAPQAVRKVRWSLSSSSIASASRPWMSLAWDCWIEQALEALLESASLMVVEQWFSASAVA